ncbi:MAG: ATP-binding cassette domain-containing protein [Acidobacteria bacterium]|nr:ATP-binding cassette domain-containing protein [Acidobacteriota bacterium]
MEDIVLRLDGVSLTIEGKEIIKELNFELRRGEIHTLLGVNGTGKSSLAYLIMGIPGYKPSKGKVYLDGKDITDLPVHERAKRGITLAWQEPVRFEGITIGEYIGLSAGSGVDISKVLSLVGLSPFRYLNRLNDGTLSGGERKRVELASVLAMKPKVAILDEPDTGIDPLSIPEVIRVIKEMKRSGSSVLLISHRPEIIRMADRASVLCGGNIQKTDSPNETFRWFEGNCKGCDYVNEPEVRKSGTL